MRRAMKMLSISELKEMDRTEIISLADELRRRRVGDIVTYVVNRNINFTNICIGDCKFCSFKNFYSPFFLSIEDILEKAREAEELGATELCIQGGLHPKMKIEDYARILEAIKEEFPDLHLHAFSPMEVHHAARNSGISIEKALGILKDAGLDSMPGTAAEILVDEIREIICPHKLRTDEWVEIVKTAHHLGIPTTATMMFGHVEDISHRIQHILLIREIQKETKGFTEFVLLPFMKENNELGKISKEISMEEIALTHALSRILLDGVLENIQTSWVKLGVENALRMLFCGANDFGGTLMEENISRAAGGTSGEYLPKEEIERLIKSVGRIPRQRDTLYNLL